MTDRLRTFAIDVSGVSIARATAGHFGGTMNANASGKATRGRLALDRGLSDMHTRLTKLDQQADGP